MKTLEELGVWIFSRALRNDISIFTKTLPSHEKFRLVDQMIRTSRSVTANIAEGYGRFHYQENIQFCRQARGSLMELIDHFTVALDEKYIEEKDFQEFREKITRCGKLLNGYIAYLNQAKTQK